MKKFLCAVLAMGLVCSVLAFAGCKKDKGQQESEQSSKVEFTEEGGNFNPDW